MYGTIIIIHNNILLYIDEIALKTGSTFFFIYGRMLVARRPIDVSVLIRAPPCRNRGQYDILSIIVEMF